MSRKTIYISGSITNDPDYINHFIKAETDIYLEVAKGNMDFTSVLNPAKTNAYLPKDFEHMDYMHICFAMLDKCQAIYMLKSWENSKGAQQEYIYAKNLGLEIYYEESSD